MPTYTRDALSEREPWVEVHDFFAFTLDYTDENGGRRVMTRNYPREIVIVLSGEVTAEWAGGRATLKRREWIEVPADGVTLTSLKTVTTTYPCELMWFGGDWNDINIVAVFQFRPDRPLELHYHDFNEYWLVFRGHFVAQVDGGEKKFRPGMMLATRTGNEHGILSPPETIEGVGFSTTMEGKKRQGHLVREIHGDPVPQS